MKEDNSRLFSKLFWSLKFVKREIPFVFISLGLSLGISYLNTLEPHYTGVLMDFLSLRAFEEFIRILLILFLIQFLGLFLSLISDRFSLFLSKRITEKNESYFYSCIMKRENSFFVKSRGAQVLNTIQNDLPITLGIWTGNIPTIITNSFALVIVSCRLISISYTVYALSVLLSIIPFFIYHSVGKKEIVLNKEGKVIADKYIKYIQDSMAVSYEISQDNNQFFLRKLKERIADSFIFSYKKLDLSQKARSGLFLLNVFSTSLIYFILGYGIYRGDNSIGDFTAAILYSQNLRSLIKGYGSTYQRLLAQTVSIDRVAELVNLDNSGLIKIRSKKDLAIHAKNICYQYRDNSLVLENLSLTISAPGLYVIKGYNGSGKTTLLNLLAGMLDKEGLKTGEIEIHGISDLSDIAFIPSSPFTISASIRDNLRLGNEYDDETLLNTIDLVGLSAWLESLPMKLDSTLDFKDVGLSKGQSIRFALARNLLRNKPIYLFDEVDDGIDLDSKKKLLEIIEELAKKSIVIVVSHSNLFDGVAKELFLLD